MVPLDSTLEHLTRDQAHLEAEDLARQCARSGCTRIGQLEIHRKASVTGAVHSLTVKPEGTRPELDIELYDGTGVMRLVWLGRNEIAGVKPGAYLTARGRVSVQDGQPVIFNPAYTLLPAED